MLPSTTSVVVQLIAAIFLILTLFFRRALKDLSTTVISRTIHTFLCYRYPVRHQDTHTPLPTCPYQWPNGQGDVAKFLEGRENSEVWGKQYGSLYRIWSGMTPEVVLTRPEHLQAVFKDSDKHAKAVNNNSGYLMSQILGQCVGLISREEWRRLRAVTEKPFHQSRSVDYMSLIEQRTQRFFDELWATKRLAEGFIDPSGDLKLLPFWIVAEIIYGPLSPELEQQLRELAPQREALFKHVIQGGLARFHWSKYLPTPANCALASFQSAWKAFNERARQRAVSLNSGAPIIAMYKAAESGDISHEQLYHTLDEMLYANLDVTIGGISWNLVFLAAYPETQLRLRNEVIEKRANGNATEMSTYLQGSTSLLSACISESARLRPLAAFSVPQSAPTARVLDGFTFTAGTNFVIDSYALNMRNPYWGADSASYRPARFFERKATETRYNFWRFGFGPRQCMGKYVADLIIRGLLVHLVERYELRLVETGEEWKRDEEMWINHPQMLLRCERREGVVDT